jgi:hypothetical protein
MWRTLAWIYRRKTWLFWGRFIGRCAALADHFSVRESGFRWWSTTGPTPGQAVAICTIIFWPVGLGGRSPPFSQGLFAWVGMKVSLYGVGLSWVGLGCAGSWGKAGEFDFIDVGLRSFCRLGWPVESFLFCEVQFHPEGGVLNYGFRQSS